MSGEKGDKGEQGNEGIKGDMGDFLRVNISRNSDDTVTLTQPHLITAILKDLHLNGKDVTMKLTSLITSIIL